MKKKKKSNQNEDMKMKIKTEREQMLEQLHQLELQKNYEYDEKLDQSND